MTFLAAHKKNETFKASPNNLSHQYRKYKKKHKVFGSKKIYFNLNLLKI